MTGIILLVRFVALAAALVLALAPQTLGSAQPARIVTATARCQEASAGLQPEVEVTVANHSGAPLTVSYVHGFTTTQAFMVLMRMVDQGDISPVVIPDGATRTVRAAWDDLRQGPGTLGAALVVTSAGALVPGCSDRPVDADEILLGPEPTSDDAARREAITIATQTLGRLESWRAYPALYQLLHPDARAEVPFAAVTCWYVEQYGLPSDAERPQVFGAEVDEITFGPWTWGVTRETYPDAAAVTYRQMVGAIARTEEVAAAMHLLSAEGQWHWFFGANRAALDALPTDCDLGSLA